jgi:hypothetical protein
MSKAGIPVTMRALVQRINRKLRQSGQVMKATRGAAALRHAGAYYVIGDDARVRQLRVDPEALARKLGVLEPWERVTGERGES